MEILRLIPDILPAIALTEDWSCFRVYHGQDIFGSQVQVVDHYIGIPVDVEVTKEVTQKPQYTTSSITFVLLPRCLRPVTANHRG